MKENPWKKLKDTYQINSFRQGCKYGLCIKVQDEIDGMVHVSDLSWDEKESNNAKDFKKGDKLKVKILDINGDKERISLGLST